MSNLNYLTDNDNILAVFDYGSVVYGTNKKASDHDLIVVVKNNENITHSKYDITVYTEKEFKSLAEIHEISVLECLFLEKKHIHKNDLEINFKLDKNLLRASISAKSSNSWVKSKKKFIVEVDYNPYIAKKSAWHTLRILDFGIQLAREGRITNYTESNLLLKPILECDSWDEIDKNFKSIYNSKSSAFKILAPKQINENKETKKMSY